MLRRCVPSLISLSFALVLFQACNSSTPTEPRRPSAYSLTVDVTENAQAGVLALSMQACSCVPDRASVIINGEGVGSLGCGEQKQFQVGSDSLTVTIVTSSGRTTVQLPKTATQTGGWSVVVRCAS